MMAGCSSLRKGSPPHHDDLRSVASKNHCGSRKVRRLVVHGRGVGIGGRSARRLERGRLRAMETDYPAHLLAREPAPPYEGEGPFALWHFSEDPSLSRFLPHVPAT